MFSEIVEVTRSERAHLNHWKDVVAKYRKDASEHEDRRDQREDRRDEREDRRDAQDERWWQEDQRCRQEDQRWWDATLEQLRDQIDILRRLMDLQEDYFTIIFTGASMGRCDFEFDLCAWEQDQNDDFDWNLRTGSILKSGPGPAADHTLQGPSGHYIFIKNSFPQLPEQKARIFSPNCPCKPLHSILFYYNMYGVNIGSLTIYQVTASNQEKVLFHLTGNQGNFWQKRLLLLNADEDFQIAFEGQVGKAYRGDIAIDDITFTKECLPSPDLSAEPTALPSTGTFLLNRLSNFTALDSGKSSKQALL
uniref:MAM domain-containing protein n=1 Tax=Gopherus agassizii TaxID=38772 RepID=A0A452GHR3_9SAUR